MPTLRFRSLPLLVQLAVGFPTQMPWQPTATSADRQRPAFSELLEEILRLGIISVGGRARQQFSDLRKIARRAPIEDGHCQVILRPLLAEGSCAYAIGVDRFPVALIAAFGSRRVPTPYCRQ
jgi:hypothetical protein